MRPNNYMWISVNNTTRRESSGSSFVVRPDGLIDGRLPLHTTGVLISTIDPSKKFYDASEALARTGHERDLPQWNPSARQALGGPEPAFKYIDRRTSMLIVDSHLDIAYNALEWDRDLLQPIAKIREAEAGMAQKGRGLNVVNFAELRRGGIGLFFVTMGCRLASMGKRFAGVRTQDIAYAKCKGELAYYRLMEAKGVLRQIRDRAELDAHLAEWDDDPQATPLGFVLSMEGADGIVAPEQGGRVVG